MGSTATGKTRLSVALATQFSAEIINLTKSKFTRGGYHTNKALPMKIVVYLPFVRVLDPDEDFTAQEFCRHTMMTIHRIIEKGRIPIIVVGKRVDNMVEMGLVDEVREMFDPEETIRGESASYGAPEMHNQLEKIRRLRDELGWEIHRIDATPVFDNNGKKEAEEAWENAVMKPSLKIVGNFLKEKKKSHHV
ncbi:adenylate isopentenyltransferase 5, chloroplastic-like [Pistacia vera]|uniref:adenylate isopentenyltransferase 5, chloroplastic-like n=1 Tax=Pistacia vera TaxID=55513 RepID=UPI00126337F3|nr:adenylate isopentenyltransferase 5, chloroplastic-like [Pistacia vera]